MGSVEGVRDDIAHKTKSQELLGEQQACQIMRESNSQLPPTTAKVTIARDNISDVHIHLYQ